MFKIAEKAQRSSNPGWNPGSDPGSNPGSNPGSDPDSNPGSKFRYPRRHRRKHLLFKIRSSFETAALSVYLFARPGHWF